MKMDGHIIFDDKNRYMVIGENHVGDYVFDFDNHTHIINLLKLMIGKNNQFDVWAEGTDSPQSKSYRNFCKKLESFNTKHNLKIKWSTKSWEAKGTVPFDRIESIACISIGVAYGDALTLLRGHLDGKMSLLEAIFKSRRFFHEGSPPTMQELIQSLSESNGKPSKILEEIQKPKTANATMLRYIYGNDNGEGGLRDKYFEDGPRPYKDSLVYKRIANFNKGRDVALLNKIKEFGGIFLAGDSHVALMETFL